MSRRPKLNLVSSLLAPAALAATMALLPLRSFAAPDAEPPAPVEAVPNTPYSATFIVNANAVYVRAGPAESYYPTMKLDKGSKVKAVGMKLDWLKVVPPDGAFCYISKAHVNRVGDVAAGRGKVSGDAVNVRAGSSMNAMKVVTLCQLGDGEEVKILGEQDEYFKIEPPSGKAFLYVNKQFVDPDPNATPEKQGGASVAQGEPVKPTPPQPTKPEVANNDPVKPDPVPPTEPEKIPATVKGTVPETQPTTVAKAPTTATQPVEDTVTVEAQFEKAEAEFAEASNKPVDQRPIAKLIAEYEPLVASDKLTNTLHRIAEVRLSNLKLLSKAADEMVAARTAQEEADKKRMALRAERKELEGQLQSLGVANYTAVGELQMSSLQLGAKTLYRLTDPANGRTVCYVRTDDSKFVTFLAKFVGIKGELATEPQLSLKVLSASEITGVDPSKINRGVTATVIPPSMTGADDASTAAHLDQR